MHTQIIHFKCCGTCCFTFCIIWERIYYIYSYIGIFSYSFYSLHLLVICLNQLLQTGLWHIKTSE